MLYLISLGLWDEKDMSVKALEAGKNCEKLYLELYTNKPDVTKEGLSRAFGKDVVEVSRGELEEGSGKIIEEAKERNVGILVGGDVLAATTHMSIVMDAKKKGVEVKVIHGSSIFIGIASSGLQLYKFGRAVTLPYPEEGYAPESFYENIKKNKDIGLHTLVLLDVKPPRYMTVLEGLKILLGIEEKKGLGVLTGETGVVAMCQIGGNQVTRYGKVKELMEDKDLEKTPAVIIIPGELHFTETEYLEGFV